MIDTICLKSPFVSEDIALKIEKECLKRQGVDCKTGDILYEITTGDLKGSFDSRLSIKVNRETWIHEEGKTVKVDTMPTLTVEGSIHKLLLGHNCYGGTSDFYGACEWLVKFLEISFEITLPNYKDWYLRRIDLAEVYELPSFGAVEEWFRGINGGDYPRRSVDRYGNTGIYIKGSTSTLKFYHKGVEFKKHDKSRLVKIMKDEVFYIQERANRILRVEVEVKYRKLIDLFGSSPTVGLVNFNMLEGLYDVEVERFLKEGKGTMEIVRTAMEVEKRLRGNCNTALAGTVLGFWYQLTTLGENYVKDNMKKPTFYKYRKVLKELNISWHDTDVVLKTKSEIPVGFSPIRSDARRIVEVDNKIPNFTLVA